MKKPFQVGDRVALYQSGMRFTGTIHRILHDGSIKLENESYITPGWHPNQCRRIKKKEKRMPREIWLNESETITNGYVCTYFNSNIYRRREHALENKGTAFIRCVRFREVLDE